MLSMVKRKYNEECMRYGFTFLENKGGRKHQCFVQRGAGTRKHEALCLMQEQALRASYQVAHRIAKFNKAPHHCRGPHLSCRYGQGQRGFRSIHS